MIGEPDFIFDVAPEIGHVLVTRNGFRYRLEAITPCIRKDGSASSFLTWSSHCPDCGARFECTSSAKTDKLNRRCPLHHSKEPASTLAARSIKMGRKKALATQRMNRKIRKQMLGE